MVKVSKTGININFHSQMQKKKDTPPKKLIASIKNITPTNFLA